MTHIGNFFSWVTRGVIQFFKNGVRWSVTQIISVIRFGWPYAFRAILSALGIAFRLIIISCLALIKGIPHVARQCGEDWAEEASRGKWFPNYHQTTFADILTVVAYLAILLGFAIDIFTLVFTAVVLWEYGDLLISLF